MARTLSFDYETYSDIDLKKYGMHKYMDSPAFEVLLLAYAFDDEPVKTVDFASGEHLPEDFRRALTDPAIIKTAYNASFEIQATRRFFGVPVEAKQFSCTMAMGLYNGLPAGLDAMARAMRLTLEKDVSGKGLINLFCKPIKPTKSNNYRTRNGPRDKPEDWARFISYCAQDVRVERAARKRLQPMPHWEQALWVIDQDMNDKGVPVDMELVNQAVACFDLYEARLLREARILTGLSNPNSVAQLKKWLETELELDDEEDKIASLNKATVKEILETTDDFVVRRMLAIRQELGKSSCKKYHMLQNAVCADGRVHGILQYYGANRTGRYCLAENSQVLVLDQKSVVLHRNIQDVLLTDLVWDGDNWVTHEGVVYSGDKAVITWDGVTATPTHHVWVSPDEKVTLAEARDAGRLLWAGN